jgi:hypothetical protein
MAGRLAPVAIMFILGALLASSAHAAATRDEYALQADPICASADKDTAALWKRFIKLDRKLKFHGAGNALEAIGTRNLSADAALRQIIPPPGDEAAINGWIALWDQIGQKWILAASAYRLGEYGRLKRLIRSTAPLGKQADALIAGFPFRSCGGP